MGVASHAFHTVLVAPPAPRYSLNHYTWGLTMLEARVNWTQVKVDGMVVSCCRMDDDIESLEKNICTSAFRQLERGRQVSCELSPPSPGRQPGIHLHNRIPFTAIIPLFINKKYRS